MKKLKDTNYVEYEIGKEYNIDTRKVSYYDYHAFKKDYYN
mgnify:CR=1 FL=1